MPHYLPPQLGRRLGSVTVALAAQVTSARPVYDTGRFWAVTSNLQVKRASATNVSAIHEHPDACCPGSRCTHSRSAYDSPPSLPACNTRNAHGGQRATDPCLGALDRERYAAMLRPIEGERCRTSESRGRNGKFAHLPHGFLHCLRPFEGHDFARAMR